MKRSVAAATLSVLAACSLTSCETPGQTAMLGAAVGATVGENRLRNAAIGAGAGYVAGRLLQGERRRAYERGYYDRDYYYDRRYSRGRYYGDGRRVVVRDAGYYPGPVYREPVYVY